MMFEATEVTLEPGVYRAKLQSIELAERSNFDTGEPESCRDWTFEVLEEGFEGQTLKGRTSMSFGPKSKAREWVSGLLARKIEQGAKIGLEDLLDRECDLSIVHKETDRGTFADISSVNPVRKKSRKVEQAEAKQVADVRDGRVPVGEMGPETEADLDSIPF